MQDDNSMIEEWRAVVGFEGRYEVSSFGRVRSLRWARGVRKVPLMMAQRTEARGYLSASLSANGVSTSDRIHRIVAFAFLSPPTPDQKHCAHLNGDPSDNRASNLKWCTVRENQMHRKSHGTWHEGERCHQSKLTDTQVREIRAKYVPFVYTMRMFAAEYGVSAGTIQKIIERKTWKHI